MALKGLWGRRNMKFKLLLMCLLSSSSLSQAALPAPSLHSIPGVPGATLEIRFTNPQCGLHKYSEPIEANSGELLTAKPIDAY